MQFPTVPRGSRHLYVVCRFDGYRDGSDPVSSFVLTRAYWDEGSAQDHAMRLNVTGGQDGMRYFVLPARVSER